jgi:hypothetical protein
MSNTFCKGKTPSPPQRSKIQEEILKHQIQLLGVLWAHDGIVHLTSTLDKTSS